MASGEMKDQWTLLKARNWDLAKSPGLTRAIGFSNRPVVCKSAKIAVPEVVLDWYFFFVTDFFVVVAGSDHSRATIENHQKFEVCCKVSRIFEVCCKV